MVNAGRMFFRIVSDHNECLGFVGTIIVDYLSDFEPSRIVKPVERLIEYEQRRLLDEGAAHKAEPLPVDSACKSDASPD